MDKYIMTVPKKQSVSKQAVDEKQTDTNKKQMSDILNDKTCGLIMPISSNDGGTAEHWSQVRKMISDAFLDTGLKIQMVSESDEVNVIHKNIVLNIYGNDIVICDVSSRNPNVMFELGMRLTFDKPVVIIKDRDTPFTFDVGNIQHLEYPRTLNYVDILSFQKELRDKTISTLEAAKAGGYSPFLSNYKIKQVSKIETEVLNREDYIISSINDLKEIVKSIGERKIYSSSDKKFEEIAMESINSNSYIYAFDKIINEIVSIIEKQGKSGASGNELKDICNEYLSTRHPTMSQSSKSMIVKKVMNALLPF